MRSHQRATNPTALSPWSCTRISLSILALALFAGCPRTESIPTADRPLKYLGIGNSFTWDSTEYLDEIAESQGQALDFFVAGIGGASLETHVERLKLNQHDPDNPAGRPYNGIRRRSQATGREPSYSLVEILKKEPWDVVSIQQVSRKSFEPETYEPFAGELIATIREHAPQAEIVVLMTWAYREDHQWFVEGELTQARMYAGLKQAYEGLAREYGLRINPVGEAIQRARSTENWQFTFPDPDFDYEEATPPALPRQDGSLNVGWYWGETGETGQVTLRHDPNHLNAFGQYLGSLTHYEFLFGHTPADTVFQLDALTEEGAQGLRRAASEANDVYRQFNDSSGKTARADFLLPRVYDGQPMPVEPSSRTAASPTS